MILATDGTLARRRNRRRRKIIPSLPSWGMGTTWERFLGGVVGRSRFLKLTNFKPGATVS
jgi:hypothetical protein